MDIVQLLSLGFAIYIILLAGYVLILKEKE